MLKILQPKPKNCGTCRFWRDILNESGGCHFNPPPFPTTRSHQWCGRWQKGKDRKNG